MTYDCSGNGDGNYGAVRGLGGSGSAGKGSTYRAHFCKWSDLTATQSRFNRVVT